MAPLTELVTLISSPPSCITRAEHQEHTRATPASFADIPPILVHREENVAVELDPPLEGLTAADCASGTLHIVESVLAFISSSGSGQGFEVKYPHITLHAISRGGEDRPCIYCQLDDVSGDDEDGVGFSVPAAGPTTNGQAEDDDGEEEKDPQTGHSTLCELKIIPQSESTLERIFEALSHCASIHSDALPDSDDDMGEDDAYIDADIQGGTESDAQELSEVGRAAREYLESIIEYPPDKPRPETSKSDEGGKTSSDAKDEVNGVQEAAPASSSKKEETGKKV